MLFQPWRLVLADDASTEMPLNVTEGSLSITAPPSIGFSNSAPGSITVANTTTSAITTNDTRGNLDGWDVTGYFNTNFLKTDNAANQLPIESRMSWYPGSMNVVNITGQDGDTLPGSNNNFAGITSDNSLTLLTNNDIANGAGAFNAFNLKFNYDIPANAAVGSYSTTLVLTIA